MRRAEADPGLLWLIGRLRQSTDRRDDRCEIAIVPGHAMLQVRKPGGELGVRHREPPQAHEHPHYEHTHRDGPGTVQDRGRHDCPVLRECPRENRRKLEVSQVVTSCDHLGSFGPRKLESKVRREAFGMAFDCLIENLGRDAVDQRKIAIQQHLLPANRQHARLESQRGRRCGATYALDRRWDSHSQIILRRSLNARSTPRSGSSGMSRGSGLGVRGSGVRAWSAAHPGRALPCTPKPRAPSPEPS
jgi:hypothetical protein